jgi:hypothetical protein
VQQRCSNAERKTYFRASSRASIVSCSWRSWASRSTAHRIFSVLTHIPEPTRLCSSVARLRHRHSRYSVDAEHLLSFG